MFSGGAAIEELRVHFPGTSPLDRLDHLVLATPDLEQTIADLELRLGVRAIPGGQHPGRGTRNALIAISAAAYLEIVGPDLEQPHPKGSRWFGIDSLSAPRLVTWAAKGTALEQLVTRSTRSGVHLGTVISGSRRRPDGVLLSWQFTDPSALVADGLVPFFIDWGTSPHPALNAPRGPSLFGLRGEHPNPGEVRRLLSALGIDLQVEKGSHPALVATLETISKQLELR